MRVANLVPAVVALLLVPAAATAATVSVAVGPGLSFSPASVTIAPGDTVQWNFLSLHTSTSDRSTGAEVWNSGVQSSGSFSHTFATPGDWPYYCFLHSSPAYLGGTAMNGIVHVVAAAAPPAITSVNPASGAPGATITITGSGFQSGATVTFRGAASPSVTFISATSIQATVPNIAAGAATIVVTNPDSQSASFAAFTILAAAAIPLLSIQMLLILALALAAAAFWALRG